MLAITSIFLPAMKIISPGGNCAARVLLTAGLPQPCLPAVQEESFPPAAPQWNWSPPTNLTPPRISLDLVFFVTFTTNISEELAQVSLWFVICISPLYISKLELSQVAAPRQPSGMSIVTSVITPSHSDQHSRRKFSLSNVKRLVFADLERDRFLLVLMLIAHWNKGSDKRYLDVISNCCQTIFYME